MNCKKFRIKTGVNRNGVIYYIAQERIFGFFWVSLFNSWDSWDHCRPKIFYTEGELAELLKNYIKIEEERAAAYLAAKKKIKGKKYICVE